MPRAPTTRAEPVLVVVLVVGAGKGANVALHAQFPILVVLIHLALIAASAPRARLVNERLWSTPPSWPSSRLDWPCPLPWHCMFAVRRWRLLFSIENK